MIFYKQTFPWTNVLYQNRPKKVFTPNWLTPTKAASYLLSKRIKQVIFYSSFPECLPSTPACLCQRGRGWKMEFLLRRMPHPVAMPRFPVTPPIAFFPSEDRRSYKYSMGSRSWNHYQDIITARWGLRPLALNVLTLLTAQASYHNDSAFMKVRQPRDRILAEIIWYKLITLVWYLFALLP